MHTMLWPDELRDGSFAAPPEDVKVSDAEVTMAQSFISALAGDFNPEDFTDSYREALETLVMSKADGVPLTEEPEAPQEAEVVDLVAALRARLGPSLELICPGVRPAAGGGLMERSGSLPVPISSGDDQARVATPAGAMAAGASRIVVGRPITRSGDVAAAARAVRDQAVAAAAAR
jgi:hypothetical protein